MFEWLQRGDKAPEPRKGMPSPRLKEAEFKRRYREQFNDPAFEAALQNSTLSPTLLGRPMTILARVREPGKQARASPTRPTTFRSTGSRPTLR